MEEGVIITPSPAPNLPRGGKLCSAEWKAVVRLLKWPELCLTAEEHVLAAGEGRGEIPAAEYLHNGVGPPRSLSDC